MRVVDADGKQLGVLSIGDALRKADERELDLVEVAPNVTPPVCRIMDYDQFRYELKKKEKEAKKKQKGGSLKEIWMSPNTEEHDILIKAKHARAFLQEGDKVKVMVRFRGRQITHPKLGEQVLEKMLEALKDDAQIENRMRFEGRTLSMLLSPKKGHTQQAKPAQPAPLPPA